MTVLTVAARRGLALVAALVLTGGLLAEPVAAAKSTNCHVKCQVVNVSSHRSFGTLQAAVDAASAGDTLRVKGTCVGSTTIAKDLAITGKSGRGYGPATLDGDHTGRVLTISEGVTAALTGLRITNGTATGGGGINNHGTLTLVRSVVTGNDRRRDLERGVAASEAS